MFQYFWPEHVVCEKCNNHREGATFFMCNEPIYSVCEVCDPIARSDARKFVNMSVSEEFLNVWDWADNTENPNL